jgi:phage terminase large subunit
MSETLTLNKSALIEANYNAKERIIINQGGTSSGKTYSLLDVFFILAMSNQNLVLTVVGQDIPNLKKGAYRDAKRIWADSEIYQKMLISLTRLIGYSLVRVEA